MGGGLLFGTGDPNYMVTRDQTDDLWVRVEDKGTALKVYCAAPTGGLLGFGGQDVYVDNLAVKYQDAGSKRRASRCASGHTLAALLWPGGEDGVRSQTGCRWPWKSLASRCRTC